MPNITHAGVWYEPGREPPGWVPPVQDEAPAAGAEPEPEPGVPAPPAPPRTPPRRPAAPDGA